MQLLLLLLLLYVSWACLARHVHVAIGNMLWFLRSYVVREVSSVPHKFLTRLRMPPIADLV